METGLKKILLRKGGRELIIILLIVLVLGILTKTNAQIAANWQVGTWSQFKTAAVSYTLDDNCSNQLPVALPLFDQYNYKVTFFTVINWSPNWSGLLNASKNGHEIGSHTMTHPASLAALSLTSQNTELGQSQSTINTNITNAKCVTVAYPNCVIGDLATIQKYYIAGRICSNQVIPSSPSDFYNLSSFITGNTGSIQTASSFNSKVDAAKSAKGWCVFLTHGIDNDGGYSPTQSSEIKTHLAYVNSNSASFWVAPFGTVVKYIKERNAANLAETTITSDSLKIVLSDNLDNTIYNVPITIRRVVPTGWQNPRVWIGGKIATSTVSNVGGTNYIVFDAIPDQGNIYLANGTTTVTTPLPTVNTPVTYCQNAAATALTATGTSLKWYTASTGGSALGSAPIPSTSTVGSTNYYVTQTINGNESNPRTLITVTVNALPSSPTVNTPLNYCLNSTASALTATGTALKWYTASSGGSALANAPTPVTTTAGTTNYYVSQTINGCESPRSSIAVTVNALPSAPTVISPVNYCQNATASALTATGSALKWYTISSGGSALANAPTPVTTSTGTTNYYVSQTLNGCESSRALIAVTVNALPSVPTVTSSVSYCQNATASALTASGSSLLWYISSSGGSGSANAPVPSTTNAGTTNYYVSQTLNGCESSRALIAVTVNALPSAPTVTSGVSYCQNATASALTASGSSLLWYISSSGGSGSANAPVPSTTTAGTTNYYVSQTVNGCESQRALIAVTVNAIPSAPTVTSGVSYCQNATASALTATGTNLKWYTVSSGGSSSANAPTPSTNTIGTTNYYVSQTLNSCESQRAMIAVTINNAATATITAGGATSFCQGGSVTLSANSGSSYIWFNGTTQVGTNATYVASTSGSYTVQVTNPSGCQSTVTSSATTVTVNALPTATITPGGATTFCEGGNVTLASSAGSSYIWYNGSNQVGTGATYSATTSGDYSVKVTNAASCSATSAVTTVTVNALPVATITPGGSTTFCQGGNVTLTASAGSSYIWYNGSNQVGTGAAYSATSSGNYSVQVSNSSNCSSTSNSISVNVNPLPTATITAGGNITFCEGGSVTLNASQGTSYTWFNGTNQIGTGASYTATTSGNYSVQVTNSVNCKATSSLTTVTVNPLPTASITPAGPTTFNQGGSVLLNANSGAGLSYAWFNGMNQVGTGISYIASSPGNYSVEVTNSYACKATSPIITVVVNANQSPLISITSPVNNTVFTSPANVTLTAVATDPDGSVIKVDFYYGGSIIGTDPTSPYNFALNNLAPGNYNITAIATDNNGATTSSSTITISVVPPANQLPTISITSPVDGSNYIEMAHVQITAIASDPDGTINQVEFYNGNILLGTDLNAPYSFDWSNLVAGNYQITAKAIDNNGGASISSFVNITVTANQPSVINITSPVNNATVTGSSIDINVTATDPDGSITLVEYYDGTTLIGSSTTQPYSYTWNNPSDGTHVITVKVTDSNGGITTSSPINVSVQTQTGIFSTFTNNGFCEIYPNPANSYIKIETNINIVKNNLKLLDAVGAETQIQFTINGTNAIIDLSTLPAGIYTLLILQDDLRIREKVIITR